MDMVATNKTTKYCVPAVDEAMALLVDDVFCVERLVVADVVMADVVVADVVAGFEEVRVEEAAVVAVPGTHWSTKMQRW